MHQFNGSGVVAPSELPVIWEGQGKTSLVGFGLANPSIRCTWPVNSGQICMYRPASLPQGVMWANPSTQVSSWCHNNGQNWGFFDGHSKWRRLGAQIVPNPTDWRVDPYTNYTIIGYPQSYWVESLTWLHAWLFRPDYDFSI
jgi:prepilin-type processing-associated H-X9-DG protein